MFTVEQIAQLYRIEAVDYGPERGRGLLVAAGTGLMMAVMDMVPNLRWCVDTDVLRPEQWRNLQSWLQMMERQVSHVASAGWWSRPENGVPLSIALRALEQRPLVYYGALERPSDWYHCEIFYALEDFIQALNARERNAA